MDSGQALSILWSIVMGMFIIHGYWNILYGRIFVRQVGGWGIYVPGNKTNEWLWAGVYYNLVSFVLWCISACLATISYFVLFIGVICVRTDFTDMESMGFLVSNSLFLIFSSLFSFLVFRVFKESETPKANVSPKANAFYSRLAVIVDLLCVSVAAFCMAGFLVVKQKDVTEEYIATTAAFYLAFHCFFVDLLWWGITWWRCDPKDIHHDGKYNIIFSAAIDTDPSTMGIFSRLRIKHKDVHLAV